MNTLNLLVLTTISTAFFHTLSGLDHYLPFIVMSKANVWSRKRTFIIVFICGIAHVVGSLLLGFIGIWVADFSTKFNAIQEFRGNLAALFLIFFGVVYSIYGIYSILKNKSHTHFGMSHFDDADVSGNISHEHNHSHVHENGHTHSHAHNEDNHKHNNSKNESNLSDLNKKSRSNSIWFLIVIFAIGPCEPIIPILMYPEVRNSVFSLIYIIAAFTITTVGVMIFMTFLGLKGISFFKFKLFEKYSRLFAGIVILLCGLAIQFLGM